MRKLKAPPPLKRGTDLKVGHYRSAEILLRIWLARLAEFLHDGLDEFLGMGEFLSDHAEVHGGNGGIALAGAVDAVLADEDEGVGDAVEGDGEAATVAAKALLEMLEVVAVFVKGGHAGLLFVIPIG